LRLTRPLAGVLAGGPRYEARPRDPRWPFWGGEQADRILARARTCPV